MSVYTLLKVVSYYDLSVLSMSVMGFQKRKKFGWGWVGEVSSIQVFFGFFEFFNFAKPLRCWYNRGMRVIIVFISNLLARCMS